MTCSYCGCWEGAHGDGCPVFPAFDKKKVAIWWQGFEEAGSGRNCSSTNLTHIIGYRRAESALEALENDIDPHQC